MNGILFLIGLPVLVLLALVLVAWAHWEIQAIQSEGNDWATYISELNIKSLRIADVQRRREESARAAAAVNNSPRRPHTAKTAADTPPVQKKLSPLEDGARSIRNSVDALLNRLRAWSDAGGVQLNRLTPAADRLAVISRTLEHVTRQADVDASMAELPPLLQEVTRAVVSKTDRDLDPRRSDARLQAALEDAVSRASLVMIDPRPGEPLNANSHRSLGTQAGTLDQRGKVSSVRCRGLQTKQGEVISPAEVLEFD